MIVETQETFDQQRADAFVGNMLQTLNGAGAALMISVGHRTGLFDTMSRLDAGTSAEIAKAASCNERYVREWLGAMVTYGIVDYDVPTRCYRLPAEHAAFLTRAARPHNLASTMQFVSVLGGVEDRIVDCFKKGGGVQYGEYKCFHQVMADMSDQTVCSALLNEIVALAPGLREKLQAGIDVLDVGCGSGHAMVQMAKAFPKSQFVGFDICEDAVSAANAAARAAGVSNVKFAVQDIAQMDHLEAFDLITAFDAIHDQAKPARVLANVRAALRKGGVFLMQDIAGSSDVEKNIGRPIAPFIYSISCMHCMSVSLAQNGAGLGAAWGRELAEEMLADAGFEQVRVESLEHDILNYYYVAK